MKIIQWDKHGQPTEASLQHLRELICGSDSQKAIEAFYSALKENFWPEFCGPERIEVRGVIIDV